VHAKAETASQITDMSSS